MRDDNFLSSLSDLSKLGKTISETDTDKEFEIIEIENIYSRAQPRTAFDRIGELAESLKSVGQQMPIVVNPDGQGRYVIEQGERRWRAAKLAGLKTLECIVVEAGDDENARVIRQLTENIQRDDMKLAELSKAVAALIAQGMTVRELAKRLGKKEPYISLLNSVAKLPRVLEEPVEKELIVDPQGVRKLNRLMKDHPTEVKKQIKKWQKKAEAEKVKGNDAYTVSRSEIFAFADKFNPVSEKESQQTAEVPGNDEKLNPGSTSATGVSEVDDAPVSEEPIQIDSVSVFSEGDAQVNAVSDGETGDKEAFAKINQADAVVRLYLNGKPAKLVLDRLPPSGKLLVQTEDGKVRLVSARDVRIVGVTSA